MPNKRFRFSQARRKRTIASLLAGGLVIIALTAGSFYMTLQQERRLTVLDPLDSGEEIESEEAIELRETGAAFEPAAEISIDEKERNDEQRRSDIAAIHSALQSYFQEHNQYPRLAQLNSEQFRENNFSELARETFKDPVDEGSRIVITRTPQEATYAYDVVDENGFTCEPSGRACVSYRLSALLSDGLSFTLDSEE